MNIIAIPARLNSSRLPEKLLLSETGQPLLQHTVECALRSKKANMVFVLADDQRLIDILTPHPRVKCWFTPPAMSGTERIAKFFAGTGDTKIVNLQGDEPEVPAQCIDNLFDILGYAGVVTVVSPATEAEATSHSVVKVVFDNSRRALYFSRCAIPFGGPWYRHIGIYGYMTSFLETVPTMVNRRTSNEKLEQLTWLEYSINMRVLVDEIPHVGIDTLEEYEQFVQRCNVR